MEELIKQQELVFFTTQIEIREENKITVYRLNFGNKSPYIPFHTWDNKSKSVTSQSTFGIYGFTTEQINSPKSDFISDMLLLSYNNKAEISCLRLEVDCNRVLYNNESEIAFESCNIVGQLTLAEFISQLCPQYTSLFECYTKAMENPDLYSYQFLTERQMAYMGIWRCQMEENYFLKYQWNLEERFATERQQALKMQAKKDTMRANIEGVINFAKNHSRHSDIHGLTHWQSVESNGIALAKITGANLIVVRLFAYVHDLCRENDGDDPEHGLRASLLAREYAGSLFRGLTDTELDQLIFACAHHTDMIQSEDVTVNTCWDADRLDLGRVGIVPLPERMATEAGAYYAANPDMYHSDSIMAGIVSQ